MMVFNRFAKSARVVVTDAVDIARELGSTTVEAEHLLLAVARDDNPAARALSQHGLAYDELCAALERETERSLAAVGVTAEAGPFSRWVESPRFGTSAKLALGVLQADVGTIPRALQIAGVDRVALRDAVRATLR